MLKNKLLKTFLTLVRIKGVSLHEGEIVKFLKKELMKLGIKAYTDNAGKKIGGEVGNLIAEVKGNIPGAPKILINSHLDTVFLEKEVRPRISGGCVYSDGTTVLGADNRAGISVILEALKVLKETKVPHGDILIIFTVAEELGLLGSKNLDKRIKADFGFTMDGGDIFEVINQAPAQKNFKVEVIGKAAHAGIHPEEGVSAIKVASEAIASMKLGRIDRETTANIGIIKGGVATNIIPEKVFLKGEVRSHSDKKLKKQLDHILSSLKKASRKHSAKLKVKVTTAYRSFFVEKNRPCLLIAQRAARNVGVKTTIKRTGGGFDANNFNLRGIPVVILGTGADRVHTKKERLKINDMVLSAKLLLEVIKESAKWNLKKRK
ncbi:MAG: M20/M25/M40 family metallo-hydrolase [Candidatus Saganbacteria bacterium]|nr:M20/M25/M40 family metallo-hydrolase [Candidatus Saganbacteria bacterium]